jgi:nucleoside-diphosphate-sugar epimerase
MACYLVTGGAGFIGSHIATALLQRGEKVRILDNFSTGQRENVSAVEGAEVVEGDIRSYHIVRGVMSGVDFVLHEAALPSVPRSVCDPITSNDVNVTGTLNVLSAARDAGVQRLVFASSSSVYGTNAALPKRETMLACPLSPYAVSKLAGENYCRAFTQIYGFETVMLRYFNVFGPRQSSRSEYAAVIPRFVHAFLEGRSPMVFGDGTQTRDFTFVDNVVAANLAACDLDGVVVGQTFNVAAGRPVSILELVRTLKDVFGSAIEPVFQPPRPGDVPHSYADIEAAREGLGYEPRVEFHEGLRRTVASMMPAEARSRRTAA